MMIGMPAAAAGMYGQQPALMTPGGLGLNNVAILGVLGVVGLLVFMRLRKK